MKSFAETTCRKSKSTCLMPYGQELDRTRSWTLLVTVRSNSLPDETPRSSSTYSTRLPSGSLTYMLLSLPLAPVLSTTLPPSSTFVRKVRIRARVLHTMRRTYFDPFIFEADQHLVYECVRKEAEISAPRLHVLCFRLEFFPCLVQIDLLSAKEQCMSRAQTKSATLGAPRSRTYYPVRDDGCCR